MENPENPSKWDELVRELGAEAPAETTQAPKPATSYESLPRKSVESAPKPKAKPAGWDNLAADFGLEVPPPPPPPPVASTPTHAPGEGPPPREAVSRDREERPTRRERPPRRAERPRGEGEEEPSRREEPSSEGAERPARRSRGGRGRSPGRRDEPRQRDREEAPRRERGESSRRQRPEHTTPREESIREDSVRDEVSFEDVAQDDVASMPLEAEAPVESKPAPSLGVSLWHKIFGSPDEQAERIADASTEQETEPFARDRSRERRFEEPAADRESDAEGAVSESWREERVDAEFTETDEAEDRPASRDDEGDEPRRRRRRRGRGRGRGRRSDGEHGDSETAPEDTQRGDEPRREPRERREPRGRGGRSERSRREPARKHVDLKDDLDDGLEEIILDDGDDDLLDAGADGGESTDSSGRETPAGHKSIPSWDEAIGMIVDTNLSTRTDRRRSPPQSRGGASRGRPRGGRRRKKS